MLCPCFGFWCHNVKALGKGFPYAVRTGKNDPLIADRLDLRKTPLGKADRMTR